MALKWPKGKRPVFVGAGETLNRRHSGSTLASLANEAALKAIADAGLKVEDIDGLVSWPDPAHMTARNIAGYDRLDNRAMMDFVPFKNIRWHTQIEGGMPAGQVITAANALGVGVCNYCLIFRSGHHPVGQKYHAIGRPTAAGKVQFSLPYGHSAGAAILAPHLQRYMEKFGAKREELYAYVQDGLITRRRPTCSMVKWAFQAFSQSSSAIVRIRRSPRGWMELISLMPTSIRASFC